MKKDNRFGGAIWTDHALDRMKERGIPKDFAINCFKAPDSSEPNKQGIRLVKRINDKTITIVTKKNERNEPIILSIWMDPPMAGTSDYKKKEKYKEYKKAGTGRKIWLSILKQLGL